MAYEKLSMTSTSSLIFSMKVRDLNTGRIIDSSLYIEIDKLLLASHTENQWKVIEKAVKLWEKVQVKQWKSYLIDMKDTKNTRRNEFASTSDKSLRYLLDIPEKIIQIIRIIYPAEVLPMDKPFFRQFAKRFKQFVVPSKV